MVRYYCDYCDTYLTHDSVVVRKQHNSGFKHKANVRNYYTRMLDVAAGILPSHQVQQQQQLPPPQFQPHHHRGGGGHYQPPPWGKPGAPYQGPYGVGGGPPPPGGFGGGPPYPPGPYGPPR